MRQLTGNNYKVFFRSYVGGDVRLLLHQSDNCLPQTEGYDTDKLARGHCTGTFPTNLFNSR